MRILITLVLAGLMIACAGDKAELKKEKFFDIEAFFEDEIEKWGDTTQVLKVVYKNGALFDSVFLNNYVLRDDLEEFGSSNINNPSLSDDYRLDTLSTDTLTWVKYDALTNRNPTKYIHLGFNGKRINRIEINRYYNSFISDLEQHIMYQPGRKYEISSDIRDKVGGKNLNYNISVYFR